ncbi:Uncharacterized protein TCM_015609 [Theobroma cacao]|uniref:Uncharacterized protein n=1 Tax=Theobroma cacao TaxID=3641 RepID=A0A061G9W7_THECC|nr:Uncharacterized protein TCM_015609 [Theobroma cacao]
MGWVVDPFRDCLLLGRIQIALILQGNGKVNRTWHLATLFYHLQFQIAFKQSQLAQPYLFLLCNFLR